MNVEDFDEKFKSGNVKILIDGFDQLSSEDKKRFLNLLNLHKKSKSNGTNQIFVTSNVQFTKYFNAVENERCLLVTNWTKEEQALFIQEAARSQVVAH